MHEEGAGALEAAVLRAYVALGLPVSSEQRVRLHDAAEAVPVEVARPAALIVDAIAQAQTAINADLGRLAPDDYALLYQCTRLGPTPDRPGCDDGDRAREVARTVDRATIVASGLSVLSAVEQGLPALEDWGKGRVEAHAVDPQDQPDDFRDPYGLVQIGSYGADEYRGNDVNRSAWDSHVQILTLDLGGDDTYLNSAGGSMLFPAYGLAYALGVGDPAVRDASTDAEFHQLPTESQPLVFGALVSVSLDLGGSDSYHAFAGGQGAGALGVGILLDLGGDDTYSAVATSQGYGLTGLGVLVDASGNDHYGGDGLFRGQGFAMLGGIGLLHDVSGNDAYAGQMMVQGVGSSDGLGALLDTGGDDRYHAWYSSPPYAAIAQGTSHTMATGILADSAGNDRYELSGGGRGWIYVPMPAPYSVGVGVFYDGAGSDSYSGPGTAGQNGSVWYQGTLGYGKDN
ncbi:MAG: hypothetical protein LC624_10710 [Halobacteriales archaeon]|nr:hypothetical protein [Halobacteriales archaeon]